MRYMLLIYSDESGADGATPEQMQQVMDEYTAYTELLGKQGMLAGDALQPTSTATTVRFEGGQILTTDGPYAETKEQLGGFYIVEAPDLDKAIELAAACPGAKYGTMEVRPIMEFEM